MQIYPVAINPQARLLIVEDFFTEELRCRAHEYLAEWSESNPEWARDPALPLRRRALGQDPRYHQIRDYFDSGPVLDHFAQYVPGARLFVSNFAIWLDQEGTGPMVPHYELSDSRLAQIFITDREHSYSGTTVYNDRDHVLLQLPYRDNSGWFFDRGSTVRHGRAHPVPAGINRFVIMAWYGDYDEL